jgi:hypothetical protein
MADLRTTGCLAVGRWHQHRPRIRDVKHEPGRKEFVRLAGIVAFRSANARARSRTIPIKPQPRTPRRTHNADGDGAYCESLQFRARPAAAEAPGGWTRSDNGAAEACYSSRSACGRPASFVTNKAARTVTTSSPARQICVKPSSAASSTGATWPPR